MNYNNYLEKLNFNKFTPIQTESFKYFNNKKNFVGVAPTGTGKTHAYLIPLIENINVNNNYLQSIIILPTNELISQVRQMLNPIIKDGLKVKAYDANMNRKRELTWLKNNQPHIVISTPEKVNDLSFNGLNINQTKYLILDEADMMFDEAFLRQIDNIITRTKEAKFLLYSASISSTMNSFIKNYFGSYDLVDTSDQHELKIEHRLVRINYETRNEALNKIIDNLNPFLAIIFVSKNENQLAIYEQLRAKNLEVIMLSSELNKTQRKNVLNDIHNLKYQYVIASDLASRGIDFDASHIINYDLPYKLEFFKHRSGRTGRIGKSGVVITIVDNDDRHKVKRLEKMGFDFILYNTSMVKRKTKAFNKLTKSELEAIRKIPKPKKVKPNYRKKNKQKIKQAKKGKYNVKNR